MSRLSFVARLLLPLLYVPLGIVLPVFGITTDYGWSVVIGFWLPILLLGLAVLPREEPAMRRAFLIACLVLGVGALVVGLGLLRRVKREGGAVSIVRKHVMPAGARFILRENGIRAGLLRSLRLPSAGSGSA
jgi:hypothetical protein